MLLKQLGQGKKMSVLVWLVGALALFLLEIMLPSTFFFLSFACGALLAAPVAWLEQALRWQLLTMLLGSLCSLLGLQMLLLRQRYGVVQPRHATTNVDALVGQTIQVDATVAPEQMTQLRFAGDIWHCRNIGTSTLQPGDLVVVVKIEGNKLCISKV